MSVFRLSYFSEKRRLSKSGFTASDGKQKINAVLHVLVSIVNTGATVFLLKWLSALIHLAISAAIGKVGTMLLMASVPYRTTIGIRCLLAQWVVAYPNILLLLR